MNANTDKVNFLVDNFSLNECRKSYLNALGWSNATKTNYISVFYYDIHSDKMLFRSEVRIVNFYHHKSNIEFVKTIYLLLIRKLVFNEAIKYHIV